MWGGRTTADELRRIANAVDKYKIPTVKGDGGQRIDLLGVKKEDLPAVWKDIGMPSATLTPKALRTIKTLRGLRMVPLWHPGQHADGQGPRARDVAHVRTTIRSSLR